LIGVTNAMSKDKEDVVQVDKETIDKLEKQGPNFSMHVYNVDEGKVGMKIDWHGDLPPKDIKDAKPAQLVGMGLVQAFGEILEQLTGTDPVKEGMARLEKELKSNPDASLEDVMRTITQGKSEDNLDDLMKELNSLDSDTKLH